MISRSLGLSEPKALLEIGQSIVILAPSTVARKAELNSVDEILITERLRQELNGATLHCLHRHWDVTVTGNEDDWELSVRRGELALKIKAALPRQSHVKHQAGWDFRQLALRKSEMDENN